MMLSKNFSLAEFTRSPRAQILQIKNDPEQRHISNMRALCLHVMQPLRDGINMPIRITSGFRNEELNNAVGGALSSQHRTGQACDFICADMKKAFDYIRYHLPFDQLIWEHGNDDEPEWVHVSYSNRHRRQVLRKHTGEKKYRPYNNILS